jgi:hypothetical protein
MIEGRNWQKTCCTRHYKNDDGEGDLNISGKHMLNPLWKVETGRIDYCGD